MENRRRRGFVWGLLVISVICLFLFAPEKARADSSGTCGADGYSVYWSLSNDGLLTVRGSGQMEEYINQNGAPWFQAGQRYQIRSILIDSGVTKVGRYAFTNCPNLTDVTIAGEMRAIGDYAFSQCPNLLDVYIAEGSRALTLGLNAFNSCKALQEISLPDNVTSIGQAAFAYCESLQQIDLPARVTELPPRLFRRCYSLESVTLPDNLTAIGERAFGDCEALQEINLPIRVRTIGSYAFENCASLADIAIPASIEEIAEGICSGCAGLRTIHFRNGLLKVLARAFEKCTALTDVYYAGSRARWSSIMMTDFRAQISAQGIAVHCSDDASEEFLSVIEEVRMDGPRVFVTVSGEQGENLQLYTAFYDGTGRFLGLRVTETRAASTENMYTIISFSGAERVKAMLLWPDFCPAAEAVEQTSA